MTSNRKEDLKSELRSLSSAILLVSGRQKKRNNRQKQNDESRPRGLTARAEQVVGGIYVLSNYNRCLAAQKLIALHSAKSPCPSLLQAERLVEDIFMALPDDFAAHIHYPEGMAMQHVATEVRRYVAEAKTRDWVEQQNKEHGVAPTSLDARAQYEAALSSAGQDGGTLLSPRSARKWTRRWQRRWGVMRGKLRKQEPLDPKLVSDKVA